MHSRGPVRTGRWLAEHLRGLATELLDGAARASTRELWRRRPGGSLRDPRELVRALLRGELSRLLADPERAAVLDRLQATMSVIEGHAEHVMDACAADLGPELAELRRRLERRRARRGGLGELIARLLGMDLKLRQYELGKAFCDAVVADAGADALRRSGGRPPTCPTSTSSNRRPLARAGGRGHRLNARFTASSPAACNRSLGSGTNRCSLC